MAYRGKFTLFQNPSKYVGNIDNVTYRSLWERNTMLWLDSNPNVKEWASEEIFFPYDHPVEGRRARYFPDFYVKMIDDTIRIIEIKPKKETEKPKEPKRKTKRYINEVATWLINQEKWKSARYHCDMNDMRFEVWTEDTLDEIGIQKTLKPLNEEKKTKFKKTTTPKKRTTRPRPKRKS